MDISDTPPLFKKNNLTYFTNPSIFREEQSEAPLFYKIFEKSTPLPLPPPFPLLYRGGRGSNYALAFWS